MGEARAATAVVADIGPLVLDLRDRRAGDPVLTGAKASALARALRAQFAVAAGAVLTVDAARLVSAGQTSPALEQALETAWQLAGGDDGTPVIVRSSSTAEDTGSASMAGQFTTVLGVDSRTAYTDAIGAVVRSAREAALDGAEAPMAVLIQRQLETAMGGVLFGADPVSGRTDRLLVSATRSGPDRLVAGDVDGTQHTLDPSGRILSIGGDTDDAPLDADLARSLAKLSRRAARVFGGPQDIEWAVDGSGTLWLLQSRPITTALDTDLEGPVWGPGPVAETFPIQLRHLEADLWLAPMAEGIRQALATMGSVPPRRLARAQIVREVDGYAVADLGLLGADPTRRRRRLLSLVALAGPLRRLRVSWRVGRLRASFVGIARELATDADTALSQVPHPSRLTDSELVGTIDRARDSLIVLHAGEVLAGMLDRGGTDSAGGGAIAAAYAVLARARREGLDDATILETEPSVLLLVPPAVTHEEAALPVDPPEVDLSALDHDSLPAHREVLRARVRWTHELLARLALEAGARLADRGALAEAGDVADACLDEVYAALRSATGEPLELDPRPARASVPTAFRLTPDQRPLALAPDQHDGGSIGAGGGIGEGRAWQLADGPPPKGAVLVVQSLTPDLARYLPRLGGLVAETGSVLSHLAIIARELRVPTVVSASGCVDRFRPGQLVRVDGERGVVERLDEEEVGP